MKDVHSRTWVFPSCEVTGIACHAAAAARVAYDAARRRIEALGAQYDCSLTMGILNGQSILVFTWEPGVDERLPAIVDAIAILVGGSALTQEEKMENYLVLAPAPSEEDCVCVGEEDYMPRARAECQRFIALLRKKFGPEPEGARLAVKSFIHDFGNYVEVVCYFDENLPESVEYAMHCEDNLPATWDDSSRIPR